MNQEMNNGDVYEPINIQSLLKGIKPGLAAIIPGFVYRKLERTLRLPELNPFFARTHNYGVQDFLDAVVQELNLDFVFKGAGSETLKEYSGRNCMFASNHPYGGPESMMMMDYIHPMYPQVKVLAQSYLKYVKPLRSCCVFNHKDIVTLQQAIREGRPLLFFPAGYCSRYLSNGQVFDYECKKTFVTIVRRNKMPLFVFHIDGQLTERTLRWTKFRNLFHIKTSFESIYLPDEMYKLKNRTITITVGQVIQPDVFTTDISDDEWAARLRQYCFKLRTDENAVFDPSEKATLVTR